MLAHELAKKLLELPNLPVELSDETIEAEPREGEVIDQSNPNYEEFSSKKEPYPKYEARMPKRNVF